MRVETVFSCFECGKVFACAINSVKIYCDDCDVDVCLSMDAWLTEGVCEKCLDDLLFREDD